MNLGRYGKTILSRATLGAFIISALAAYGIYSTTVQLVDIFLPGLFRGLEGLATVIGLSVLTGLVLAWPRRKVSKYFAVPNTRVTVKVGDIFREKDSDLVIGFNDVFDTEVGVVISPNSLQGKFLNQVYGSNREELDGDLASALEGVVGVVDASKVVGKNLRYPLGTVVTLRRGNSKYYCSAYARMGADLVASSSLNDLWYALDALWSAVRLKGECKAVAIPVVGSELARISSVSYTNLIKLILLSYSAASHQKVVSNELTLLIHPSDVGKVNLKAVENFVNEL